MFRPAWPGVGWGEFHWRLLQFLPVISFTPILQTHFYPNATFPRRASGWSREFSNKQCSFVYRGIPYRKVLSHWLPHVWIKKLGIKRRMIFTLQRLISKAQLVEALHYTTEGRRFDSHWIHWDFSLTWSFRPRYDSCVSLASNRNEYLRYLLIYGQHTFTSRTIGYCMRGSTVKCCCSVVNALSLFLASFVLSFFLSFLPSFCIYFFLFFFWLNKIIQAVGKQVYLLLGPTSLWEV